MALVLKVVLVAVGILVWWGVSLRFPRIGAVGNGAGILYVIGQFSAWSFGFGWTVLGLLIASLGLAISVAGLIASWRDRRRSTPDELPRARLRR